MTDTAQVTATVSAPSVGAPAPYVFTWHDGVMAAVLAVAVLVVIRSFVQLSRDHTHVQNLRDLVTDEKTGGMSKTAVLMWLGVGILSWGFILAEISHTSTDAFRGLYAATVVAPAIVEIIKRSS